MNEVSTASDNLVTYERSGHVGVLKLNRPEKRNALNLALWESIGRAVAAMEEDSEARVVVLKGEGQSFCAGLDLSPDNEIISIVTGTPNAAQKMEFYRTVRHVQQIHTRLERTKTPTIAAIQGHCLGAGLELALCCDMRVCTEDAVFALPEAKLAIITDVGGLQRLPKVVGEGHAREISYRGHRFDAEYARSIGLVNHVYSDVETMAFKTAEIADEIAGNPPLAVQGAKDVFLYNHGVSMDEAMDYTAARSSMIMPSEDIAEAMAAHMQKRPGKFKGC